VVADREHGYLYAVGKSELVKNVGDVVLDSVLTEAEFLGNFFVAIA
jgi:hypothetical protein